LIDGAFKPLRQSTGESFGRAAKAAGLESAKNSGKNADSQLTDRQ
jgi:hypothetical protein